MNAESKIRATRKALLMTILGGLALGLFGVFIGVSIPGLIVSVMGWLLVIAGLIWLVVSLTRRSTAVSGTGPWRPGDVGGRP